MKAEASSEYEIGSVSGLEEVIAKALWPTRRDSQIRLEPAYMDQWLRKVSK